MFIKVIRFSSQDFSNCNGFLFCNKGSLAKGLFFYREREEKEREGEIERETDRQRERDRERDKERDRERQRERRESIMTYRVLSACSHDILLCENRSSKEK